MEAPRLTGSGSGGGAYPGREADPELRHYLETARRRWWLIALAGLIGLSIGWWSQKQEVAQFTAESLLQRETNDSPLVGLGIMGEHSTGEDLAAQLEILRSSAVLLPVVDSMGLRVVLGDRTSRARLIEEVEVDPDTHGRYLLSLEGAPLVLRSADDGREVAAAPPGEWLEGAGFRIRTMEGADPETPVPLSILSPQAAVDRMRAGLRAEQVQRTNLIRLRYTGSDPVLAAGIVNEVARSYQRYSGKRAQEEAKRRREFIAEQLAQVADSMYLEQERLQEYQEEAGILDPTMDGQALAVTLLETEAEWRRLRFQEGLLETVLVGLRSETDTPEAYQRVVALGSELLPVGHALYSRLRELEVERERLTASRFGYTDQGSRVEVLDSLISVTREEMRAVTAQSLALLRERRQEAERRSNELRQEVGQLPAQAGAFGRLKQQVDAAQQIFNVLSGKYYEAQIAEAVESGNVEIVDRAPVPSMANPRSGLRTLLFSLLGGIFMGGVAAIVLERLNTSIRKTDDVERVLGLSTLATVPRLRGASRVRSSMPAIARNGNGGNGGSGAFAKSRDLVALNDNRSSGAEAYRTLRTNLLFSELGDRLRTVVVTSAATGEGKTTVAANLATSFAQQGVRVLLVDADLRKSRLHKMFGQDREPGLSEWLTQQAGPAEAIRRTDVDSLFLLVSGALPENPSEMLGSPRMMKLVETLREAFELVIFDSPPLMAAADAAVLGSRADGVVLVLRAGDTDEGVARQAVRQLERVRARVLGVVLNDPDATAAHYGDYYHYEHYGEGG